MFLVDYWDAASPYCDMLYFTPVFTGREVATLLIPVRQVGGWNYVMVVIKHLLVVVAPMCLITTWCFECRV